MRLTFSRVADIDSDRPKPPDYQLLLLFGKIIWRQTGRILTERVGWGIIAFDFSSNMRASKLGRNTGYTESFRNFFVSSEPLFCQFPFVIFLINHSGVPYCIFESLRAPLKL